MDRAQLWDLLGVRPGTVRVTRGLPNPILTTDTATIPCTTLIPEAPRATILYAHAHGNRFDIGGREITDGRGSLQDPPLGQALAAQGFAVIAPDLPGHGARQHEGPESALSKEAHWRGETLFGHMIRDLCAVLDALPDLNLPHPVGTVGFSMGSFLSLWLAVLRPDIAACAHLCGVTSLRGLIATGNHDLHAPYLTVPGLLTHVDLPDIAALIAPRPQFIGAGLTDPLTPPETFAPLRAAVTRAYPTGGATFSVSQADHFETPTMRRDLLSFLDDALNAAGEM